LDKESFNSIFESGIIGIVFIRRHLFLKYLHSRSIRFRFGLYGGRKAKQFELIGGKLVAEDSTKLRAQNCKKNNFNEG